MKTRYWILIFVVLALVCGLLCLLLPTGGSGTAQVYSHGELVMTIDLSEDASYRIGTEEHWNQLTVSDGKLRVSAASCPAQDCVHRGAANSGLPILCLPNELLIKFSESENFDAIIG